MIIKLTECSWLYRNITELGVAEDQPSPHR